MILTHHGMNSIVRSITPVVTVVNIGGRDYKYVQIGNQLWLSENLDWKFTGLNFRDSVNNQLDTTTAIQAAYYNYDESTYGVNGNKYGLLYNYYAVDYLNQHLSDLGVPDGWHIPTNDEWSILASTCGNSDGTKLKSTTGWDNDGNGTDDYGFNAKPSGQWTNGFSTLGEIVVFYSTTLKYDYPIVRFIWYDDDRLHYDSNPLYMAYSVRLVKNLS